MKMTLHSTSTIVKYRGVYCRVWNGETAGGVRCKVLVALVGVHSRRRLVRFEAEMAKGARPTRLRPLPRYCIG